VSLKARLEAQIAAAGPLTVAQYMTACLWDPEDGYYAAHPHLGEDFITAPMVSQMFGELVGLWAAETWAALDRPARVVLAEIGPGDGSLIHDALRAARAAPGFLAAAEVWLVEASRPLAALQRERLGDRVSWANTLAELPPHLPLILIANEVLDCLPARQFVPASDGWAERMVGLDQSGELAWGLRLSPPTSTTVSPVGEENILEQSPAQAAFAAEIAHRLVQTSGSALLIDYGRAEPGFGDTLQAVRRHRQVDPLACPGEADLTVHADFPAALAAAREAGAHTTPVLTQAEFLRRLGIHERAAALSRARPDQASIIARQLDRLTGLEQMGELFKVAAVYAPEGLTLPAFEES
jgi:SAM-dependent MidA family methyltransferase